MLEKDIDFESLLRLCFCEQVEESDIVRIDKRIQSDELYYPHLRLLPFVYKRVEASFFSQFSLEKMKSIYRHTYYRNKILIDRADRAQKLLHQIFDWQLAFLKGLSLVVNVYDDVGVRPMSDIDILVPGLSFYDAGSVAERLGDHCWSLSGVDLKGCFFKDAQGFEYDLHGFLSIAASNPSLAGYCIQHSQHAEFDRYGFNVLSDEHLFAHVVFHGSVCPFVAYSKRWIFDALAILKAKQLSVDALADFVNRWDAPFMFSKGIDQLLALPADLQLDRDMLLSVRRQISQSGCLYAKLALPKPTNEYQNVGGLPRTEWFKRLIYNAVVCPFVWRRQVRLRDQYALNLAVSPGDSLLKCLVRKVISMVRFLVTGRYQVLKSWRR